MSQLLDILHEDHKNFIKLLTFIESQLECIKNCEVVDFETILIAMIYMRDYPDKIHHPRENTIFQYFLQKYDTSNDEILELMNEHEGMPQLTEKIIDMLERVVSEAPINRYEFCENLSEYLDVQKEHMNLEESAVYPAINENMKDSDWSILAEELSIIPDPLFHEPKDEKYSLLLHKISAAV